ncbi:hypothetical protein BV25DRAFT_1812278 [Artomyces pyxidatus]|uniref:Uncharacterized protein n=1 Tax=Artomyces pyxidatus TaxID=48021 RepID=A0ACB8SMA6_9AGAM|nr:hypothetical protein BV25DRAFT_1812278 [Artomyces pyxidatus]
MFSIVASQSTRARRLPISPSKSKSPKNKRRSPRTVPQKLAAILTILDVEFDWTLGKFLHYVFRVKDEDAIDGKVHRTHQHAAVVSAFLGGRTVHKPAHILDAWLRNPDGRPLSAADKNHMYSLDTPYLEILPARAAITSFAVQVTRDRLIQERRSAVKPSEILKEHQPLTFQLLSTLATPKRRGRYTADRAVRQESRPPELVTTQVLSSLNFSHNRYANRLPLAMGILYFATGAQSTLFRYGSRTGLTVSHSTVYVHLDKIGHEGQELLKIEGLDDTKSFVLRLDNVQTTHKQWEGRVWREDQILHGTAAIVVEADGFLPAVTSREDKDAHVARDQRRQLTVDRLHKMIDYPYLDSIASTQWLQTLVNYIPELAHLKADVIDLYRTTDDKLTVPPDRKSKAYPLSTSGKHETLVSELKDALLDFFNQMGQTKDTYKPHFWFVGGDGLTFEKMVQLKQLLQFEPNGYDRLDWLEPFLELWHTEWTDLSRIFEAHWGEEFARDPSSLGHNAGKINFRRPSKLKKVDYYSGTHLVYLVLDVRMIDCWRVFFECDNILQYFSERCKDDNLPTLLELRDAATLLHRRYSSLRAFHRAMGAHDPTNVYSVPLGSSWSRPSWLPQGSADGSNIAATTAEAKSATAATAEATRTSKKKPTKPKAAPEMGPKPEFRGDAALAQSTRFMWDAILSRAAAEGVAAGAIGRVWEICKLWVFTFAGSSHTKYPGYLLEMICSIELESSPELREFFLKNWLVNLRGAPGKWMEGDLMVEHNNDDLQSFLSRKDATWDGHFLRNVVSPNTFRLGDTKVAFIEGAGLKRASTFHPKPHTRPEFRILSEVYKTEGLHTFRPGRTYGTRPRDVNDYDRGVESLMGGKLATWIKTTTSARGLVIQTAPNVTASVGDGPEDNGVSNTVEETSAEDVDNISLASSDTQGDSPVLGSHLMPLAWRYATVINGEFVEDVGIEDMMREVEEERIAWEDEELCDDWQEVEPAPETEVEFVDGQVLSEDDE